MLYEMEQCDSVTLRWWKNVNYLTVSYFTSIEHHFIYMHRKCSGEIYILNDIQVSILGIEHFLVSN